MLQQSEAVLSWLINARHWAVTARPVFNGGYEEYKEHIAGKGYKYLYFSPMRPLNFIDPQIDHELVSSTEPHHDFIYTRNPFPNERIYKWELIPANSDAWDAVEGELGARLPAVSD